jgi:hypothetical protein
MDGELVAAITVLVMLVLIEAAFFLRGRGHSGRA